MDELPQPGVAGLHQPLPVEGHWIRVMDLKPGRPGKALRAKLRTVALKHNPYYEALSYTWGASTKQRTIKINGEYTVSITDNLYDALQRLRRRSRGQTMWVDAICINQSSTAERSQQVSIMCEVY
ncbi:hypothetical protein LTR09_008149 [Extremus antarcticus]|uniref:Heterokaryon incompatibility domain-containing protein n=1 Tax=Extremus antarcticus TaxID=702011 RepID=A0AAJ0DIE5_9PEZI|nr:hypothetical protein LTR09_008149 [Extremus antarcticus]